MFIQHSVKAAASLSNISSHCLRAWERRYQAVVPSRSSSGRRVYSEDDIKKLQLISALIDQGHSIGNLARLTVEQLRKLSDEERRMVPATSFDRDFKLTVKELLQAACANDVEEFDRRLIRARLNVPLTDFIILVVAPLLGEIGKLVQTKKFEIAQEHLVSSSLRNHLGEILALMQKTFRWSEVGRSKLPRFIFTTPENELHEFGILLGALLVGNAGFKFQYLGVNTPAESLAKISSDLDADIIVLGVSSVLGADLKNYIASLRSSLRKSRQTSKEIWVGGNCELSAVGNKNDSNVKRLISLNDFIQQILRVRKRVGE